MDEQPTVECEAYTCFQNKDGICWLLREGFKDKPCPFFKTRQRVILERMALKAGDWELYKKIQRMR